MRVAYPVFIARNDKDYLVYIPDMDIFTEGKSPADAIAMARDAICLTGIEREDEHEFCPEPSSYEEARIKTMKNADDADFRYTDGICTLVDVDFDDYRKRLENKSVKKNCTIPYWMSVEADKAGVNYSRVLQDALRDRLNLKEG